MSTNAGRTSWSLISGTSNGTTATTSSLLSTGSCALYDPIRNRFYSFASTTAYISTDGGVSWNAGGAYGALNGFGSEGCTLSRNGTIFLIGGSQTSITGAQYSNDVFASFDGALSWQQQTATAAWSNRDSTSSWVYNSPYLNNLPILTIFGGDALTGSVISNGTTLPARLNQEVWASSDSGVSWRLLGFHPFAGRDHTTLGTQVSAAGVVVITAGKLSESVTLYGNDVSAKHSHSS